MIATKQIGFSLIELAIVLSVASVFAAMATPGFMSMIIKSNLYNAQMDTVQALRKAKNIARSENTNITVEIAENSDVITLKRPNDSIIQTIKLPKVSADSAISFTFNALGTVNQTGTIILVSQRSSYRSISITIENLFGLISIS
jgi:prepilin-type N-terminal cleavage/methylation domain-containing protein